MTPCCSRAGRTWPSGCRQSMMLSRALKRGSTAASEVRTDSCSSKAMAMMLRLTWIFWPGGAGLLTRTTLGMRLGRVPLPEHQDAAVHGRWAQMRSMTWSSSSSRGWCRTRAWLTSLRTANDLVVARIRPPRPAGTDAWPSPRRRPPPGCPAGDDGVDVRARRGLVGHLDGRREGPVEDDADRAEAGSRPRPSGRSGPSIFFPLTNVPFLLPVS